MGQSLATLATLATLAGEPVVDPTPPSSPSPLSPSSPSSSQPCPPVDMEIQTEPLQWNVVDSECVVCLKQSNIHYLCCWEGHGACWTCLMDIMRTSEAYPQCPICRNPFLERLIPNRAFNQAVRLARTQPPMLLTPLSQPMSPRTLKRTRDPEAIQQNRRRRAAALASLGAQLVGNDVFVTE